MSIYKMQQHLHQMSKVEMKETSIPQNKFNQLITKKSQNQQINKKGPLLEYSTYQIDHKMLPFIFRFNYVALQRLKMKKAPNIPKLAYSIFDYLRDKLIVRRYSEGGKYPNRMKYEEKVKFLMRAFDHRRAPTSPLDTPKKKEKFNRLKQLQFFTRPQVRQHFLQQINDALLKKRLQNQRRIRDIQDCIQMAISFLNSDSQKAYQLFQQRIKRKQLPWTDNMFLDIEDFSKQLYSRYSSENIEAERAVIKKQIQEKKESLEEDEEQQQIESFQRQEQQNEHSQKTNN